MIENRLIYRQRKMAKHEDKDGSWSGKPQIEPDIEEKVKTHPSKKDNFRTRKLKRARPEGDWREAFMRESNAIEGEMCFTDNSIGRLNPYDISAVDFVIDNGIKTEDDIMELHSIVGSHIKEPWVGAWRKVGVKIGDYYPPNPGQIRRLMHQYICDFPLMTAWEAHNEFEFIHPFQDLNGRMGRLIWLYKMLQKPYWFPGRISFLHEYYYATLSHTRHMEWKESTKLFKKFYKL